MPRNVCRIRACAYARVPALHGPCKLSTYRGKVRVRPCVPRLCALEGASLGATCMHEPALFPVPVQVHMIVRVGFCAVRAHERFGQCANAASLCSTARGQEPYCTSSRAVRASKGFALLCTVRALARCEPTKALRFCVPYERQELCAVRASKGFVPLCTVRTPRALRGASLQRLCASVCCKSLTSFVRCEPTKAFYRVRAPRALRGASLQRLCACVCCKSLTSFVRCEPTKAFYRVLVLAPQDLLCARVQEPVHMYCLYELTRYLLFCTGTCMPVCRGTEHSRGLVRLRVFSKHPQSRTI